MANEQRLDLIDRNAVLAELCGNCFTETECQYGKCSDYMRIRKIPTVDAVEVIRCKNCEHYEPINIRPFLGTCWVWDTVVKESGFCHQGERKDNGR